MNLFVLCSTLLVTVAESASDGRTLPILNDTLAKDLKECKDAFMCPITKEFMFDPVITADGHSYEASAINEWFRHRDTSPLTNTQLPHTNTIRNHALRKAIHEYVHKTIPGIVSVTGAGHAEVNGWYHRREPNDATPSGILLGYRNKQFGRSMWLQQSGGRPWYEKHDGHHIRFLSGVNPFGGAALPPTWLCNASTGGNSYFVNSDGNIPPTTGWEPQKKNLDPSLAPAPTIRVS